MATMLSSVRCEGAAAYHHSQGARGSYAFWSSSALSVRLPRSSVGAPPPDVFPVGLHQVIDANWRLILSTLAVLGACAPQMRSTITCPERAPAPPGVILLDGPCAFADNSALLLIVDGMPIGRLHEGNATRFLRRLDPRRIESITVLKGPDAVRQYGGTGAYLLTTKPGTATP